MKCSKQLLVLMPWGAQTPHLFLDSKNVGTLWLKDCKHSCCSSPVHAEKNMEKDSKVINRDQ